MLLPSFLQSSGVIPAAALAQVVNNAKSDLQTVFGVPISEIKLTHEPTTTSPPANVTNVTTTLQPTQPTQPPTIATTEKSDDWKWIVIGVVVGVVVIVIIIVVVVVV